MNLIQNNQPLNGNLKPAPPDLKETLSLLAFLGASLEVDRIVFLYSPPKFNSAPFIHQWTKTGIAKAVISEERFNWWFKRLHQVDQLTFQSSDDFPDSAQVEKLYYSRNNIRSLLLVALKANANNLYGFISIESISETRPWQGKESELAGRFSELLDIKFTHSLDQVEIALEAKQHELKEALIIQNEISDNLLKTTSELNVTNRLLQMEVLERKRIEAQLLESKDDLELRVNERTKELKSSNEKLLCEIAKKTEIENELRKSQQLYYSVVEGQSDLIYRFTNHNRITFVNEAFCRFFDCGKEELLGKNIFDFIPQSEQEQLNQKLKNLSYNHPTTQTEHRLTKPNEDAHCFGWHFQSTFNDKRKITEIQAVGRDITDRKTAESELMLYKDHLEDVVKKRTDKLLEVNQVLIKQVAEKIDVENSLKESEERFRQLAENIPDVFWISELPSLKVIYANSAYEKIWEKPRTELYQDPKSWMQSVLKEDKAKIKNVPLSEFIDGRYNKEFRIIGKNGSVRWIWNRAYPVKNRAGEIYRIAGVAKDITERKNHEFRLARFKAILDLAGEAIMMLDLKTKTYFDVNQKAQKMYGYSKKEFLKLGHQDIDGDFKAKTDKQWEKLVKEIKKKGDRFIVFGVNRRKNGTTFPVEAFFNYNRFDNQQYLLVMVRDITERIKAEEEKRTLAAAIEQTGESIIITDTEGIIQYVNPAFQKITGYSIKETLGKKPSLTKSDKHDREYFHQLWQTIKNGDTWRGRLINKRKNGSLYEEETTISPIRDEKGELKNFVAVKRDMTYQNKLEKQLRESQKLEAIGTLAGGLAHDFNNILCSILGYITLAKDEMLKNNPSRSDLEMALQAGEYAKDLIAKILAFSHQNESEFRPVKLPMILLESLKMLRPMLPSTIEIKNTIPQEDLNILADPIQIQQVIMNLCTNSGYAMKDRGGILSIDIVEVELDSKIADLREITPGSYVKVQIKDTGSGIHPKHLNRIFDPFFTTKPVDQGTGLGMAVVHGIVKNHQGAILVKSALNAGTTVEIYFPKIDTPEVPLVDENLRGQRGNEKILLVDDENLIVLLLKKALGKMGYKITTADNALNALELFNDPEMDFDLVITDQTMPKMTGLQLSKKILKKNPKTPIILMTGFDPNLTSDKARSVGIKAFVTKPILPNKLSRIIRSVLDEEKVSAH